MEVFEFSGGDRMREQDGVGVRCTHTCNVALGFPPATYVQRDAPTRPPAVFADRWGQRSSGERGFACCLNFNKLSPGFRERENDVAFECAGTWAVPIAQPSMCARACVRVWACGTLQQHRRRVDLFPVKSRSPHNKGPGWGGGVVTRRISFFFGLCDLPFLCFTSKAPLVGRSPRLCISDGEKERCPPPLLTSLPSFKKHK